MKLEDLDKIDSSGMYRFYDDWPKIARESYDSVDNKLIIEKTNHIAFCGMGGSGAIGDFIASILSKKNIHVSVIKGYTLPKIVDKNTLVVAISVSGNTEETLVALKQALALNCKIVAFSSGGKIEEFCDEKKITFHKLKLIHSPRVSFVNFLFPILKILEEILPIEKSEVNNGLSELKKTKKNICSQNLTDTNQSLSLASFIHGIPLIYYPYGFEAAAIRFKNSLQENAKIHVISEDLIEACHNGIVVWEKRSSVRPILIRGTDDHIKTKERWELLKKFFDERDIEFKEIVSKNGDIFTKLINLIYTLDFASLYKAIQLGIDPTPVKSIDYMKKLL